MIEIKGIKGLLTAIFVISCFLTGLMVLPGFLAMQMWNFIAHYITNMPQMQLLHGVMLWGIIFLIWYAFNGCFPLVRFGSTRVMTPQEINEIIERMKQESSDKQDQISVNDNHTSEEK